ncbi:hypothetical protein M406DRAFT_109105 [Cryphonectria parasitica EP155]|uniref:Uncharacterized protein n=1 Tax=Cryphonectria parasitica (strain ATCC 38755 / EP155) TaxID=660469 RepID=A0A9P4XZ06_CRYP1|nr:uncharacterized protein M406DRAFT_109105 [Cryphonectria parasitica EP155]KAF3763957.1 hypothetical protein M406DRAFT_109105 [Cryphonectria parasitica EP155]
MAAPTQIEAKSLSAINQLAAHPPQYPINPVGRHETLCLYISRVPGSRDVILSTFKPQRKNVTGEDVANSLYYIHLDNLGDELLAPRSHKHEDAPRASMDSTRSQERRIIRKPVPTSAGVAQQPVLETPTMDSINTDDLKRVVPLDQPSLQATKENVPIGGGGGVGGGDPTRTLAQPADLSAASSPPRPVKVPVPSAPIARKPLGPRQMADPPSLVGNLPPPPSEAVRPVTPPTPEEVRPVIPPRPTAPPLRLDAMLPPRSFDEIRATHSPALQSPVTPSRSPSPWSKQQKPFTPFSLTIIRRNPGTGHQWNIGKVSSYQSTIVYHDPNHPDALPIVQYPRGYPAINIHIETSGYARFRDFTTTLPKVNFDAARPGSAGGNLAQNMKELAAKMQAQQQEEDAAAGGNHEESEGGFRRQVVMTYGKTWTHNLKEVFASRKRDRSGTGTSDTDHLGEPLHPPPKVSSHQRQDSGASTASADSSYFPTMTHPHHGQNEGHVDATHKAAAADDQPALQTPGPGLRPKGYTFTSPWDGQCDFRTASNGRSLKCRHTRNTTSQGFNPLVAAQALRDAASSTAADSGRKRGRSRGMSASLAGSMSDKVDVSELRFSLPSTDLFGSKEDRERAAKEVVEGLGRMLVKSPGGREKVAADGQEADEDEDDEPVFDFSGLGRERAGGGNRGTRAKLGKLLVHDEGLKMLDLVVAANMGIWWQAWERSF